MCSSLRNFLFHLFENISRTERLALSVRSDKMFFFRKTRHRHLFTFSSLEEMGARDRRHRRVMMYRLWNRANGRSLQGRLVNGPRLCIRHYNASLNWFPRAAAAGPGSDQEVGIP